MKKLECTCAVCINGCKNGSPGWFLPGEAEKTARLLGMSFKDFKNKYLIIDFWVGLEEYHILAPLKVINPTPGAGPFLRDMEGRNRGISGQRVSWGYGMLPGRCIFLNKHDRCKIHKAKPHECAKMMHTDKGKKNIRKQITLAWGKFYRSKSDLASRNKGGTQ